MIWLLGGYLWLYVHRPFEVWPFLGTLQIERLYALGMIAFWAVSPKKSWCSNRLNLAFLFFAFSLIVSWTNSPFPPHLGEKICEDFGKVFIIYVLLTTSIQNEADLRKILTMFFVALFFYQTHSFLEFLNGRHEVRMSTIRMIGVDFTHGNPNSFAGSLIHALPFLIPFWESSRNARTRQIISGYVAFTLLCVVLTGSRRAILGVGFLVAWIMMRSRHKLLLFLVLVFLSPVAWALMRDDLQNRFLTLVDKSYGPENAHVSGESRYLYFLQSLDLWNEYPLTGVGPAAFGVAGGHGMQSHNLYAQILAELGSFGVLSFSLMLLAFWQNSREITRIYQNHPEWGTDFVLRVGRVTWFAVVLLLFMGLGGHNLFRYNWLWFGAFQAIAVNLARKRAAQEMALSTVPAIGFPRLSLAHLN